MAASLLGTIEEYLTSDVIQRASTLLGESPGNTEAVVQNAVPALLGGMIECASTVEGAETLIPVITRAAQSAPGTNLMALLNSDAAMEQSTVTGRSLLATLFGNQLDTIVDRLASSCGVKPASVSSLLAMLTPLVLTIVGREAETSGGGAVGLMSLLTSQKAEIMSFLPSGLTALVASLGVMGCLVAGTGLHAMAPHEGDPPSDTAGQTGPGQVGGINLGAAMARGASSVRPRSVNPTPATAAGIGATTGTTIGPAAGAAINTAATVAEKQAREAAASAADRPRVGATDAANQASAYASAAAERFDTPAPTERGRGWLMPLILLALLGLGAWYFMRGQAAPADSASTMPVSNAPDGAVTPATSPAGRPGNPPAEPTAPAANAVADTSKATADDAKTGASSLVAKTTDATKDAARKTADVSKDVARKTADVTKDAASATADAAKKVGGATKDGAEKAAGAVAGAFNRLTGRNANGTTATVALPDGQNLELPEGSANYQLARYLEGADAAPKSFVFERINFFWGSARLTRGSRQTVSNLAAILKAYPTAEVSLEGHTDSTGDTDKNRELSRARADTVKSILERSGVAPARVATAGHGQDKPIASNDTSDGRQQNRRIEVAVIKR